MNVVELKIRIVV